MTRPRLLDLFCCEGGAGTGYSRAGFDVTGVDIEPRFRKRYPFKFHASDAITYVERHGHEYDVIHASPPCQAYSITKHSHHAEHPMLIEATREALLATGRPYVIENVVGAPLLNPLTLCGTQFGLTATDADGTPLVLQRHRLFESNIFLLAPGPCLHKEYADAGYSVGGVYGGGSQDRHFARNVEGGFAKNVRGGYTPHVSVRRELVGAEWMTMHGLSQSIPPAYTEFIGAQILDGRTLWEST